MSVEKTAVLGAGSWGTTYAAVVADAGFPVTLWARRSEVAEEITTSHTNERYLGDRVLPELLSATADDIAAVTDAEVIILAVPAQTLRENLSRWKPHLRPGVKLVSLMKGIEVDTGKRMSEVIAEVAEVDSTQIAVVSGPNLAREIADRQPTATVVASESIETAEVVAQISANGYFRPYTNTDVVGVEMGGAVKNVIALAVGIADGQKLGDNSKASIITRGLAETSRLAAAMGAAPHTLSGLAGLGDLVATCASPLSRNRTFGRHLGEGMSLTDVIAHTSQTAEGVKSAPAILALGRKYEVDLPITEAVCAVLGGRLRVDELSGLLLSRKRKHEGPSA
ncbi:MULTISPECIES: NAD(P)H-dependent glycerol-3-phosphate dehydrogenase [Brevibacterium]|uniref:Glycerol-3-phosphate dehydrogenase [NAD(P)+] n=2 Tax=Brevibacterium antiquum TaxID=234835 RepID=A0A2H1JCT8_9MICO|nr:MULTISPECIES: NAD(P)H-dependent glycerol-3-phosphate dehydrogenase [Brevibacterium]SMX71604.1 glycerol 3-phosphate dehydrogenase (NAD(P)+) [Brevibacterium antiquum]SMX85306.1 glycerol 3-phosphate dehydrogenase (NAD(P)+) [Brevibacterium antiquum CNRZ 918]HCG55043.1 NAD(P)-dependent glycerol-3-phosphate dehydrogenase [Brevibacterium sp.]